MVVAAPLLLVTLLPAAPTLTSTGLTESIPLAKGCCEMGCPFVLVHVLVLVLEIPAVKTGRRRLFLRVVGLREFSLRNTQRTASSKRRTVGVQVSR